MIDDVGIHRAHAVRESRSAQEWAQRRPPAHAAICIVFTLLIHPDRLARGTSCDWSS